MNMGKGDKSILWREWKDTCPATKEK